MIKPEPGTGSAPADPRDIASPAPPTARSSDGGRSWRVLAWVAPLVVLALNLYVMWGTTWPAFPFDEVTLLQMSRMVAGEAVPDIVRGAGYYPAWAIVIAPIWWFTDDPSTGYQASLYVGVLVSVATIWPLSRIVERLGVHRHAAIVVASFVMALPARTIQADYSMSERLVTLVLVVCVLAAYRVAERPTYARHAVFALALGVLLLSHVRMSVVLGAAAVWLLLRAARHLRVSLAGLAMVVLAYVLADSIGNSMNEALLGRSVTRGDALLERIGDSRWQLFLRTGIGQSWYQSLASYGMIAFGVVVVGLLVWRELRAWRFGGTTFVLGAMLLVVFVSLAQWANDFWLYVAPWTRLDVWVYGRYIDPIATVLVAIGLGALVRGLPRWALLAGVGLNLLVAVVGAGYLTREVPTWGFVTPAHIPGVLPWWRLLPPEPWARDVWIVPTLTNENRIWLLAPLCVLVVLVVAVVLRSRPAALAGGLMALAAVGTVLSVAPSSAFHEAEERSRDIRPILDPLVDLGPEEPIGYVLTCGDRAGLGATGQNYLGYAVAPSPLLQVISTSDVAPGTEVVLACAEWDTGERIGARRLDAPSVYASYVWVLPGDVQDEMEEQGRLLPVSESNPALVE